MDRRFKLEVALASLIVVVGALAARQLTIPPFPERQVELAAEKYDLDLGTPNKWFSAWSVGDGQASAVIAADPSGVKLSREIKEPTYRFIRAGYGWMAALVSLGQEPLIPHAMGIVGAAALIGVLWLAIRFRGKIGPRAWLLVLNPALYLAFAGDTGETLALFALSTAIGTGVAWASIAVGLTRPSYLVALLAGRRFVLGLAAAIVLLGYAVVRFGTEGLVSEGERFTFPVAGFLENPTIAGWVLVAVAVATVIQGVRARDWAWMMSGLLVLALGSDVTSNISNAWRAAGMLPVLWAFGPGYEPNQKA